MPNQSGPTSTTGKAASSRNAMRHRLTNLHAVVTEADRPEYEALRELERLQRLQLLQDVHFGEECTPSAPSTISSYINALRNETAPELDLDSPRGESII